MRLWFIAACLALAGCGADGCIPNAAASRRRRRAAGGSPTLIAAGPAIPSFLAMNQALAVQCYGQSNCLVTSATPLTITSRPAFADRTYAWNSNTGAGSLLQLFENNVNTGAVESPASGFGHALVNFEGTRTGTTGRRIFIDVGAIAGQTCAQLSSGTSNYNNMIAAMGGAVNAAQAAWTALGNGATTTIRYVPIWIQGEADNFANTTEASYVACLLQLQTDLQTSLNALEGTSQTIPLFLNQLSNWNQTSVGISAASTRATIALYQWHACRDNPARLVCSHPAYGRIAWGSQHVTNVGSDRNGEMFAKPVLSWLNNNGAVNEWALRPTNATCNANVVSVTIGGGYDATNLAVDTTDVVAKGFGGMSINCPSQGTDPVFTSTSVSSRTITGTLNRNCTSDCVVYFGRYATTRASVPGGTTIGAPGTNYRTSDTTNFYVSTGVNRSDWLLQSDIALSNCTSCGTSAETTWIRGEGSIRNDNSPQGFVDCDGTNLSTLNASAHVSWSFWVRHTSWPTGLSTIFSHMTPSATQWGFRSSTATARALRQLIAANTNDFGTFAETPVNTMSLTGWNFVCAIYDGTQVTNALKLLVNVANTPIVMIFTGTIPTALTTVGAVDLAFGADAGGGTNGGEWYVQDLAIWPTTTISPTDCSNLWNGGTPRDPIGVVTPDPAWNIPLHTNLEVKGTAAPLGCMTHGTGVTRQATAP